MPLSRPTARSNRTFFFSCKEKDLKLPCSKRNDNTLIKNQKKTQTRKANETQGLSHITSRVSGALSQAPWWELASNIFACMYNSHSMHCGKRPSPPPKKAHCLEVLCGCCVFKYACVHEEIQVHKCTWCCGRRV